MPFVVLYGTILLYQVLPGLICVSFDLYGCCWCSLVCWHYIICVYLRTVVFIIIHGVIIAPFVFDYCTFGVVLLPAWFAYIICLVLIIVPWIWFLLMPYFCTLFVFLCYLGGLVCIPPLICAGRFVVGAPSRSSAFVHVLYTYYLSYYAWLWMDNTNTRTWWDKLCTTSNVHAQSLSTNNSRT